MVVGLDLGTTLVKALLLDGRGIVHAAASSRPLSIEVPRPGYAEQDPVDLWSAVVEAVGKAVAAAGDEITVIGLAVAAQSGSTLVIGRDDRPRGPLITWMDTRAEGLVDRWRADGTADLVRSVSGWSVAPGLGLPVVAQMGHDDRSGLSPHDRVVGPNDYVTHRLTGRWVTNPSNAAGLQLMELATAGWSDDLCRLAGIGSGQLSPIESSGSSIGSITHEAARETGLAQGLPVFGGGHDQACTALGLGLLDPGDPLISGGTAWVLTTVAASSEVADLADDINVSYHVAPGLWTHSRLLGGFGAAMEQLLEEHVSDAGGEVTRDDRYRVLAEELAAAGPAPDDVHFLSSRFVDSTGTEIPPGRLSEVPRGVRARAIMEHSAVSLGAAVGDVGAAPGRPVSLVGGATASLHWPRLLADVSGLDMIVARSPSWPATGAALIAASAAGIFESLDAAVASLRRDMERTVPDPSRAHRYRARLETHRRLIEETS